MREKTREEIEKDRKTLIAIMGDELQRLPIEDVVFLSNFLFWYTREKRKEQTSDG